MGKKGKSTRRFKRLQEKRAKKAAMQALYASYAKQGIKKQSKRFARSNRGVDRLNIPRIVMVIPVIENGKQVMRPRMVHGGIPCGNIGCRRCFYKGQRVVAQ